MTNSSYRLISSHLRLISFYVQFAYSVCWRPERILIVDVPADIARSGKKLILNWIMKWKALSSDNYKRFIILQLILVFEMQLWLIISTPLPVNVRWGGKASYQVYQDFLPALYCPTLPKLKLSRPSNGRTAHQYLDQSDEIWGRISQSVIRWKEWCGHHLVILQTNCL